MAVARYAAFPDARVSAYLSFPGKVSFPVSGRNVDAPDYQCELSRPRFVAVKEHDLKPLAILGHRVLRVRGLKDVDRFGQLPYASGKGQQPSLHKMRVDLSWVWCVRLACGAGHEHGWCPVSSVMRYGQRAELRCLKYLRRLRASVVSPIMRQIDTLSVLSPQVKEPMPHLGETPTRMPHIRAPCLGLDETGQLASFWAAGLFRSRTGTRT